MADVASALRTALDSTYRIEREVGRGGMSIVYAAHDVKHQRRVALKVLRPELAASIAADRFLREIAIAARLNHPHILPLYDSGRVGEHVFFVAPFVEGESLRQRLDREKRLDVTTTIAIARDIASALAYSHAHGVIHRDIKPENTLLHGSEAVVADFGIAHAIEEAGDQRLTHSGWAVGTAMYLAPEQALGVVDPRSDIYSLGCVMYEMLAGEPPFRGATAGETVGMHLRNEIPSLSSRRPDIPHEVDDVVMRALAKEARDRFANADELLAALSIVSGSISAGTHRPPRRVRRRRLGIAGAAAVVILLVAAAVLYPARRATLANGGIAIFPFSVRGTVDTSLVTPDALMELLASNLPGDVGPRAMDPHTVIAKLGDARGGEALKDFERLQGIAQSLGASTMLVGSATGSHERLDLSGIIYDASTGEALGPITAAGRPDSVLWLVDELSRALVLKLGNVQSPRTLLNTNLPAVRRYVAGLGEFRHGRYTAAINYFREALGLDSTFALAALRLAMAQQMGERGRAEDGALSAAWRHRDRLSAPERLYLRLLAGPNYPARSSYRAEIGFWNSVIDTIPERGEAAWNYGDLIFHQGAASGYDGSAIIARNMLMRALEVDSAHAPALEHLLQLAIVERDTATVRRMAARYFALDSLGDNGPLVRWMVAGFMAAPSAIVAARASFPSLSLKQLSSIAASSQLFPLDLESGALAAEEAVRHAPTPVDIYGARKDIEHFLVNSGRPGEANRRGPSEAPYTIPIEPFFRGVAARFWGADSTTAGKAVVARANRLRAAGARIDTTNVSAMFDLCAVGLWNLQTGDAKLLDQHVRAMRAYEKPFERSATRFIPLCAATIDASLAAREKRPTATSALEQLDSLVRENWETNPYIRLASRMTLAELFVARGDYARALRAVRRRSFLADPQGVVGLSTLLREEGQLAAQVGDTVGARRAYEHYLALRTRPEPSVRAEVEGVRAKLRALEKRER